MSGDRQWRSTLPPPTPDELRKLRGKRTHEEMAELAGLSAHSRWVEYEAGRRRPAWQAYEWLLLKLGQHPTHRLVRRGKAA